MFLGEMLVVAIMFLWSYNFGQYKDDVDRGAVRKSKPIVAFLSIFWPLDIFKALISGFREEQETARIEPMEASSGVEGKA